MSDTGYDKCEQCKSVKKEKTKKLNGIQMSEKYCTVRVNNAD